MKLLTRFYQEPELEFGEGEADTPKTGLEKFGPYTLRLGATHPARVRVGLVGPSDALERMRAFLRICLDPVGSGSKNLDLAPNYPGFGTVFRCTLALDSRWDMELNQGELDGALGQAPTTAFQRCLDLWSHSLTSISKRDLRPDVVICCIPQDVLEKCGRIENRRLTPRDRAWLRRQERERESGQLSLLDLVGQKTLESESLPSPEDMLFRDFRRSLKVAAMRARLPIQVATPQLWEHGLRRQQDAATRAWNLSVALFYKAGGIPWRIPPGAAATCFVGITFHHLRTTRRHVVYSSLAQAFSTDGEGFALRGDAAPWSEDDRVPHLTAEQSNNLINRVLEAYRERMGRDPVRLVIHKTSKFLGSEVDGFNHSAREIPSTEFLTLRSGEFRTVRQGTYPPHRGSLFRLADASFLFTSGYMTQHHTYPGPHIPAPIEILPWKHVDIEQAAADILGLTKMNWNSAASFSSLPITLGFARKVGAVMSELPEGEEPQPSFRYYM